MEGAPPWPPTLGVVIVTYRSAEVIGACLESLDRSLIQALAAGALSQRAQVVVVDNGYSGPPAWPTLDGAHLQVIEPPSNVGFAVAVNLGLEQVGDVDWVLLLNPDARPSPDCLQRLLEATRKGTIGLVGPILTDEEGIPRGASERPFHSIRREAARQLCPFLLGHRPYGRRAFATGQARCLTGACMLARADLLSATHGLDTKVRMYLEDVELCWQAHRRGYEVILEGDARCRHELGGSSQGVNFETSIGLHLTLLAARVEFIRRRSGPWGSGVARALMAAGALARLVVSVGSPARRAKHATVLQWALKDGSAPRWTPTGPVVAES
jgi:GT2 family glycosyltransferase